MKRKDPYPQGAAVGAHKTLQIGSCQFHPSLLSGIFLYCRSWKKVHFLGTLSLELRIWGMNLILSTRNIPTKFGNDAKHNSDF
jgi:hypothetical protein